MIRRKNTPFSPSDERGPRTGRGLLGALGLGLILAGCGQRVVITNHIDGGMLRAAGLTGGTHLLSCGDLGCGGGANPPLGGPHCGSTIPCRRYDTAQARCIWLHNLEHGHAVLAYNCPADGGAGCADLVAKLGAVWEARQTSPAKGRIILTPDPQLPRKLAVIVWGFGWQGDELDEAAVNEVLSHQDEEAPEKFLGCEP